MKSNQLLRLQSPVGHRTVYIESVSTTHVQVPDIKIKISTTKLYSTFAILSLLCIVDLLWLVLLGCMNYDKTRYILQIKILCVSRQTANILE